MQIITLTEAKTQLGVTFSATDAAITLLVNGIEAEILSYLNAPTLDAALAHVPDEMAGMAEEAIRNAVRVNLAPRRDDSAFDIWKGGRLTRALFAFKVPGFGPGTD